MMDISVGIFYSAHRLLTLTLENQFTHSELLESFRTYQVADVGAVLELAQGCNWLFVDEGGRVQLARGGVELARERDAVLALRRQLRDFIERYQPPWSKTLMHGRSEAGRYFPHGTQQAFNEAGLMKGEAQEIVTWWDTLGNAARQSRQTTQLEVGRRAERLSFEYEHLRTGNPPLWQSLESNFAGYDILSKEAHRTCLIEVKGSEQKYREAFCYITRNEWRVAERRITEYMFHLWLLRNQETLLLVSAQDMAGHIPSDVGQGRWETVRVPFSAFPLP